MGYRKPILGRQFIQALLDAGVIQSDEMVKRVVIVASADEMVTLYVERVGDERLIDVALKAKLEVVEASTTKES